MVTPHLGFRDRELARKIVEYIKKLVGEERIVLMHVCGTYLAYIAGYAQNT